MRILLTAFEPFDGTGWNAGLEGCRRFLERWGGAWDLRFAVLPVRYGADTAAVEAALAEQPFDVLLHIGQAAGRPEISVERIAVNVRYPGDTPRSDGAQREIIPGGPPALFATLPVDGVAAAIRAAGASAAVSNHAGIYLCNHVLYQSLLRTGGHPNAPRVGFLHIPLLPEQAPDGAPALSAEQTAAGIHATLLHLRSDPARTPFREL